MKPPSLFIILSIYSLDINLPWYLNLFSAKSFLQWYLTWFLFILNFFFSQYLITFAFLSSIDNTEPSFEWVPKLEVDLFLELIRLSWFDRIETFPIVLAEIDLSRIGSLNSFISWSWWISFYYDPSMLILLNGGDAVTPESFIFCILLLFILFNNPP